MSASPAAPARPHETISLAGEGAQPLGRYTDPYGLERELLAVPAAQASTLVVDRLASTGADPRLVAQLFPDEPTQNASLVASMYLADHRGRRCRPLRPEDFGEPARPDGGVPAAEGVSHPRELRDADGQAYRLEPVVDDCDPPELRWRHHKLEGLVVTVTVRSAIGRLESYEPVRSLSAQAIEKHRDDPNVSVAVLRGELQRVRESPIVLNRGLREAVLQAIRRGFTMSEIAIRCARVKRDASGKESGETSWLARRIGTLPEGGRTAPTPWVHTDVLALIAREGLSVAPREVEVS